MPLTQSDDLEVGQQVWVEPEIDAFNAQSGGSAQVLTPVNRDGYLAVAMSEGGARTVHVSQVGRTVSSWSPQVPPAPHRAFSPIRSLSLGYSGADSAQMDVTACQHDDGSVTITLSSQDAPDRAGSELEASEVVEVADAWLRVRDRSPRGLPSALEAVGFSFVPTMFDSFGGSSATFRALPPEHTERIMDWLVRAADNL